METDILIVGGGPGGATAAHTLVAAGREVLIIDRATFPRPKPCGGGVPLHTCKLFNIDITPVIESAVGVVALEGAWTGRQLFPVADGCKVVDRTRFDHFLVNAATAAGATLKEHCTCKNITRTKNKFHVETTQGETIRARTIIAADGAYSPTGRALGFARNDSLGVALEAIVPIDAQHDASVRETALFHFTCLKNGYGWIFPRGDVLNVGIGSADRRRAPTLRHELKRFMESLPELRGRAWTEVRGGQLPNFSGMRETYTQAGAYLIGDAAGFIDPLTGEGIYYAVLSGQEAAAAILGDGERQYENVLRGDILPELYLALRYAKLFHRLPLWMFGGLMCTPQYRTRVKHFIKILSGSGTYRDMQKSLHPRKPLPIPSLLHPK